MTTLLEATEYELYNAYNEMLDFYGGINVCGYEYLPHRVLKAVDEIAYHCGFHDFVDGMLVNGDIIERENGVFYWAGV